LPECGQADKDREFPPNPDENGSTDQKIPQIQIDLQTTCLVITGWTILVSQIPDFTIGIR
jgi:hypothetical protein